MVGGSVPAPRLAFAVFIWKQILKTVVVFWSKYFDKISDSVIVYTLNFYCGAKNGRKNSCGSDSKGNIYKFYVFWRGQHISSA